MADRKRLGKEAGVAGGLGGTGVVGAANLLPPNLLWLKPWLTYASPWLTVAIGFLWAFIRIQVAAWWNKRNLDEAIEEACAERDRIRSDPNASQALKDNAQKYVEGLQQLKFVLLEDKVRGVRATLTGENG